MPRKIEAAERTEPPLEPTLKPVREPNWREHLLTAKEAASFLRLSPSWLAKAGCEAMAHPMRKSDARSAIARTL